MRRVVGNAIGLAVIVLAVFIPAAFFDFGGGGEENFEETTITRYVADFDVAADGTMAVTETLTVNFPSYGKHGIFRFWDVADPNAPDLRREPEQVAVTLDGEPEEFVPAPPTDQPRPHGTGARVGGGGPGVRPRP